MQELSSNDPAIAHLRTPFPQGNTTVTLGRLPFAELGGKGFERLCFDLLLVMGKKPRFFGNPGQSQYGIDLLVEEQGQLTVYQCKNYSKPPSAEQLREALQLFEEQWLKRDLPMPITFVYTCSQSLAELKLNLVALQASGFKLVLWGEEQLSGDLRSYPNLVAEHFSPEIARVFCKCQDLRLDIFRPMARAEDVLQLATKQKQGIWIPPKEQSLFCEKLMEHSVVWVHGLPGLGKTLTYTEMTRRFGSQWRCYYLDLKTHANDLELLREGIEYRKILPTLFVLDNCHEVPELVTRLVQARLRETLTKAPIKLICLARTSKAPIEEVNLTDLAMDLVESGAVITVKNDPSRFKEYLVWAQPGWSSISNARVKKLQNLSGDNLLILDHLLSSCRDQGDIDSLKLDDLYQVVGRTYFNNLKAVEAPNLLRLAALAQFEVAPEQAWIKLTAEEQRLARPLTLLGGEPARHFFLHGSSAELVFHRLARYMGEDQPTNALGQVLEDYTHYLGERLKKSNARFVADYFEKLNKGGLALIPSEQVKTLYRELVQKPKIQDLLRSLAREHGQWMPWSWAVGAVAKAQPSGFSTAIDELLNAIKEKASADDCGPSSVAAVTWLNFIIKTYQPAKRDVWESWLLDTDILNLYAKHGTWVDLGRLLSKMADPLPLIASLKQEQIALLMERSAKEKHRIGTLHLALRWHAPEALAAFEEKMTARRLLTLTQANGTLFELFRFLQYSSAEMAQRLVADLNDEILDGLLQQTLDSGRSIGTLNLALRELSGELLAAFEEKMTARRLLTLTQANGTLFELFRFLQYSSAEMAQRLVADLNDEILDGLLQQTLDSGRSIGTLNLALRELSGELLAAFEEKMTARRLLTLTQANGTLFELFRFLQYSSAEMAQRLVADLNDEILDGLFQQTLDSGRSIGTLHLALRELSGELLAAFEEKMTARRLLTLIQANGTLIELFMFLGHSSAEMAQCLVADLNDEILDGLLQQTLDSGRSIGTLDLALRELSGELLAAFEEKMTARRLLTLIQANGTLFELFMFLKNSSAEMAQRLIADLNDEILDGLLQQTLDSGRSIGTLNLTLKKLAKKGDRLEQKLGPKRFWDLMLSLGSMRILTSWLKDMSPAFASICMKNATAFHKADWAALLQRGNFRDVALLVKECPYLAQFEALPSFQSGLTECLPQLIQKTDWTELSMARSAIKKADSPIARMAQHAFTTFMAQQCLPLPKQTSFSHATSALACLLDNHSHTDTPLDLAIESLFPSPKLWPKEEKALQTMAMLVRLMCSPRVSFGLAQAVWHISQSEAWFQNIAKEKLDTLFDYAWSCFMLWWERLSADPKGRDLYFSKSRETAVISQMTARLDKLKSYEVWHGMLMLVGLFKLWNLNIHKKILHKIREKPKGSRADIKSLLIKYGFFKTYFILRGQEKLFPNLFSITQSEKNHLLIASRDFEFESKALKFVRGFLC